MTISQVTLPVALCHRELCHPILPTFSDSKGLGCCARADGFTFGDLVPRSHIQRFKPSNEDTGSAVRMLTL
ncbi:hypothetical protein AV530_003897 [Patagioenas fasciata monilis]|uniref:Uncharacterized protein n=1 Tax=Patagioenas fasciata monilis TaxID=372326 RepID=A0A1V4KZ29_PATFA|nr:hypothetical protein AV530_003897 [Patagioenas fasciata monilis]